MDKSISLAVPSVRVDMPGDSKPSFPRLYLNEVSDLELPDSGVLMVKFKVVEETEHKERDTCSYTLDITSIEGCECDEESEAPKRSKADETEEALEKLRKEKD